jgi:DNA (cytosine-5)-methyltransferase 1
VNPRNKVLHYDLFAGIGGFSYAIDCVYGKENVKHIFVEINPFCQAVLKKHWKEGEYWNDIKEFIADTFGEGYTRRNHQTRCPAGCTTILTGGFPCQPFSQAGKKRGTKDKRYLWEEMFRAIQLVKPQWVIAENVRGILTIEGGMVFERICSDLETEGYEVQAFIIPAVAVNAPHRRDRVWIIAHSTSEQFYGRSEDESRQQTNAKQDKCERKDWERNWEEVAFERCLYKLDDGLPRQLVRLPNGESISYARWRREGIKAFGNAIVPQVAIQIIKAIKYNEENYDTTNQK